MIRYLIRTVIGAGMLVTVVAAAAVPAGAGPSTPDAMIAASKTGPYVGKGLFTPPTPIEDQQVTQKAPIEKTRKFFLKVKEVGGCCGSEVFLKSTDEGTAAFEVKWLNSTGTDITSDVFANPGYSFVLSANGKETFKLKVHVTNDALPGDDDRFRADFNTFGMDVEAVRAQIKVKG